MTYKLSQYNVLFTRNDVHYIWNTFSGALIKLDQEAQAYIAAFNGEKDDSSYFSTLYSNGCIVKTTLDELGKVLYDEKAITFNNYPNRLFFTIAPGLSCNYNCIYCFENKRSSFDRMTDETQEALVRYINRQIERNPKLERISITWFGGEPLLYTDIIYSLSLRIMECCRENGIDYYSGMITNGRYLTKENVQVLSQCKLGHIQVSIDGMADYYEKMKGASKQDFYAVVNNLIYACEYLPLAVRINTGADMAEAIRLTDYLLSDCGLDGKIKIYIAHTRDYDEQKSARIEQQQHKLFLENERQYMSMFGKQGKYKKTSFEYRVPKRRGTTCLSVCQSNACIGPNGEIYQCEHHFGIQDAIIGNIYEGKFYQDNNSKYLEFQHYKKCLSCSFFPVCLGGCLDDKVNSRNMIDCQNYRKRLIDLKMFALEH